MANENWLQDLPIPTVFYDLDYEGILAEIEAYFLGLNPDYTDVMLESDPIKKNLETMAYRELHLKSEFNEKAKQTMLAYATGTNLDNIAANTVTKRLVLDPGDPNAFPPRTKVMEEDEPFRTRAQAAPEKFTVAGPYRAYEEHAKGVDARIIEATCHRHTPIAGAVTVVIIASDNDGAADPELLQRVLAHLSDEDVRPCNDTPYVIAANMINLNIDVVITYYKNSDKTAINTLIRSNVEKLKRDSLKSGEEFTRAELIKRCKVSGVQNVEVKIPETDIKPRYNEAVRIDLERFNIGDGGYYGEK